MYTSHTPVVPKVCAAVSLHITEASRCPVQFFLYLMIRHAMTFFNNNNNFITTITYTYFTKHNNID